MKNTFKVKALMLLVIALMVVALVPNVKAADVAKFENEFQRENAKFLISVKASKTTLHPGDEFEVSYVVNKDTDGYGIHGMSSRLVYDSSKVEIMETQNEFKEPVPDVTIGDCGKLYDISGKVTEDTIIPNGKCYGWGFATGSRKANSTGNVLTIKFKVKEDAMPGKIDMFMKSTTGKTPQEKLDNDGFAIVGWMQNEGKWEILPETQYYVDYNYDDLMIEAPATGVKFTQDSVSLDTGSNKTLDLNKFLEVTPKNTTDEVKWSIVNGNDVIDLEKGVVTGKKTGTAKVKVTVGKYSATITINVTVALEGIEFDSSLTEVNLDRTTNKSMSILDKLVFTPEGAAASNIEWKTENDSIATVSNGVVTAVGKGDTYVYAKVGEFETAHIPVHVAVSVGSVSINESNVVLELGTDSAEQTLTYTLNPADADAKSVEWSIDDNTVADIDSATGKLTAKHYGHATVTLTVDGHKAQVNITVSVPLTEITVDEASKTVYKGQKVEFTVTPGPEGAEWSKLDCAPFSGTEFVEYEVVGNKVVVTGLKEGTAVLQVVANGSALPALVKNITIEVKENRITSATLTAEDDEEVLRGKTKQLTLSYEVEEPGVPTTDDTKITWASENEEVATVDENGLVTALKEGTAKITATIAGHTAEYTVTVKEIHAEGLEIDEDAINEAIEKEGDIEVGTEIIIPFKVVPENCTDTVEEILEYVQSQYDEDMVDVTVEYDPETQEGKITVKTKKAGDVEVTFSAGEPNEDLSNVWTLNVTVVEPPAEAPVTGDMPVAMMAIVMLVSLAGLTVTKRILVK